MQGTAFLTTATANAAQLPYILVPLSPSVTAVLAETSFSPSFSGEATGASAASTRIGVGDLLSITIFESTPGGLFIPPDAGSRPGNFVQIPNQQVDREGLISVPFGQRVRAAGRTPAQVEQDIQNRLTGRAQDPQVVVTIVEAQANIVSVLGDVTTPVRFPLGPAGERLLTAIARAGGPRHPAYEVVVTLQRAGRVERALLSEIARRPEQNIQLQPEDVVFLSRQPRQFLGLGAMGTAVSASALPTTRRFTFEDERLTLAAAIGRAGGLLDDRADPRGVFLLRTETAETVSRLGVAPSLVATDRAGTVATVYAVDLAEPTGYFLAESFSMRDGDIIFVSNAPAVEVQRFLSLILPFTQAGSGFRSSVAP